jgi:hypothetical protein
MSLPAKASGRSIAPWAVTTFTARMRHSRFFGRPSPGVWSAILLLGQQVAVVVDPRRHAAQHQRHILQSRTAPATVASTHSAAGWPSITSPSTGARPPQCAVCSKQHRTRAPEAAAIRAACKARDPAAHDQQVAMGIGLFIAVGIRGCDGGLPRPALWRITGSNRCFQAGRGWMKVL